MVLNTERLHIRSLQETDWPALLAIWRNFSRSPYAVYDAPLPTGAAGAQALAKQFAASGLFFAVCRAQQLIGYVGFRAEGQTYDVGYCFHSAWHGRGYARESVQALMQFLMQRGPVAAFTAGTALDNAPSRRLLESLGFVLQGTQQLSFHQDASGRAISFVGGVFRKEGNSGGKQLQSCMIKNAADLSCDNSIKRDKISHCFSPRRFLALLFTCILIFSFSLPVAYAHSGGTDKNGGHYDHNTGEYHYHHGYPAHQHPNGTCPYNFDDKTGESSGTDGSGYTSTPQNASSNAITTSESPAKKQSWFNILFDLSLLNFVPSLFLYLIFIILKVMLHAVPDNKKIIFFRWHYLVCLPATLCYLLSDFQINGTVLLATGPIFFFFVYALYCTLLERRRLENEKKKYREMYEGKEPFDLCNPPQNAYIDENDLPHQIENNRDIFDVLITPNGKVFHCRFSCPNSLPRHVNYYHAKHRAPCKKCNPTIPNIEWYETYLKIKEIKKKYDIK